MSSASRQIENMARRIIELEARCAQLEQALRDTTSLATSIRVGWTDGMPRDVETGLRRIEALAGPDTPAERCPVCEGVDQPGMAHNPRAPYCTGTPADSPILSDKNPSSIVGVPWNEDGYVPADSQPKDPS